MEMAFLSAEVAAVETMIVCSVVEAVFVNTLLAAQRSIACLFVTAGSLLKDSDVFPTLIGTDGRFPMAELRRMKTPDPENKDASDTEDDDDDDDEADDPDDDAGDEDFSGEEGGDDDEADPEENPEANGNEGSDDDEDDDDDDGDEDEDGDDEDEDEDEEDEEDEDQPPAKKRK